MAALVGEEPAVLRVLAAEFVLALFCYRDMLAVRVDRPGDEPLAFERFEPARRGLRARLEYFRKRLR